MPGELGCSIGWTLLFYWDNSIVSLGQLNCFIGSTQLFHCKYGAFLPDLLNLLFNSCVRLEMPIDKRPHQIKKPKKLVLLLKERGRGSWPKNVPKCLMELKPKMIRTLWNTNWIHMFFFKSHKRHQVWIEQSKRRRYCRILCPKCEGLLYHLLNISDQSPTFHSEQASLDLNRWRLSITPYRYRGLKPKNYIQ